MAEILTMQRNVFALTDDGEHPRMDTITEDAASLPSGGEVLHGVEVRTVEVVSRTEDTVRLADGKEFISDYHALRSESAGVSYGWETTRP